jgi:hypothetical protein
LKGSARAGPFAFQAARICWPVPQSCFLLALSVPRAPAPKVRFGSLADIKATQAYVRFTPKADTVRHVGSVRYVPEADINHFSERRGMSG